MVLKLKYDSVGGIMNKWKYKTNQHDGVIRIYSPSNSPVLATVNKKVAKLTVKALNELEKK